MKVYYFYNLKALWDGQGKIKMYYGMSRVKKQKKKKRSIVSLFLSSNKLGNIFNWDTNLLMPMSSQLLSNKRAPSSNFLTAKMTFDVVRS